MTHSRQRPNLTQLWNLILSQWNTPLVTLQNTNFIFLWDKEIKKYPDILSDLIYRMTFLSKSIFPNLTNNYFTIWPFYQNQFF